MDDALDLPPRRGPRPRTTTTNPHQQLDQNAPPGLQEALVRRALALAGVTLGESIISGEGARAFILDPALTGSERAAFFGPSTEFAHIHRPRDGSLHLKLPPQVLKAAAAAGWGEPHPMAARLDPIVTNMMLYGPRNEAELEIASRLVERSHRYATTGA